MNARSNIHAFSTQLLVYTARLEKGGDIAGGDLAHVLHELTAREVAEGGPYTTHPGDEPTALDVGFNLLVARFLAACDVHLPQVDAFLAEAVSAGTLASDIFSKEELQDLVAWYASATKDTKTEEAQTHHFTPDEARLFECIKNAATERFADIPSEMATIAEQVLERMIRKNPDKQMSLMPYYMREALGTKGDRFSDEYIAQLGLANMFFWSAFIIYDDFWDEDEDAQPSMLPTANLFARHYTDFFAHLIPKDATFRTFFHSMMDALDAANTWETVYCRMKCDGSRRMLPKELPAYGPDFDIKFYPAYGHVVGPVALLMQCGYALDTKEVAGLIAYFKHYLIAMQLNDDAHDWKEDIERGHISTAVSLLLDAWRNAYPDKPYIDIAADMPVLEQLFWFEVVPSLCTTVLAHTERSYKALSSLESIEHPEPLAKYIEHNARIAQEALTEQQKSVDFIAAYDAQR